MSNALQRQAESYIAERKIIEHKLAITEEALRFAIEQIEDCPESDHDICKMGTLKPSQEGCLECWTGYLKHLAEMSLEHKESL